MEYEADTTVVLDLSPFVRIYKSGRLERLVGTSTVPAGTDPVTCVTSRDILINPTTGISARLYLPPDLPSDAKLPILVYFHGGEFVIETAASPMYHNYLNLLVSKARILAVSVEYRHAPEHPFPAAYDDCWEVLASTVSGSFPDEWVSGYGDLRCLYLGGDSAGGNMAHHIAIKAASEDKDQRALAMSPMVWSEGTSQLVGGLGILFESISTHTKIEPKAGGSVCKLTRSFKPLTGVDTTEANEQAKAMIGGIIKGCEAYLVANPDAYN